MSVTIEGGPERSFVSVVTQSHKVAEDAVRLIQAEGERLIVEKLATEPDSRGIVGREDTGGARKAVQLGPIEWHGEVCRGSVDVVGEAASYWPVIEGGRRPNKPISLEGRLKIRTWVRRNLLDTAVADVKKGRAAEASKRSRRPGKFSAGDIRLERGERDAILDSLTFVVVRAIRRRGIPGIYPFAKTARILREGKAAELFQRAAS